MGYLLNRRSTIPNPHPQLLPIDHFDLVDRFQNDFRFAIDLGRIFLNAKILDFSAKHDSVHPFYRPPWADQLEDLIVEIGQLDAFTYLTALTHP